MGNILFKLNLMVAFLWLGAMIADFHWLRLFVSVAYVLVYAALLFWFDDNRQGVMFYLVGYFAAFFALYLWKSIVVRRIA
ncbi:hypothetical protein ACF3NW_05100 [Eikenella halliae]|uniref:hypothetical protein n=1 Tax=Eikenella halliae TaxID=1795832 RepID=UPI0028D4A032|nr:hypothetical protein [Eikenella halliae]